MLRLMVTIPNRGNGNAKKVDWRGTTLYLSPGDDRCIRAEGDLVQRAGEGSVAGRLAFSATAVAEEP